MTVSNKINVVFKKKVYEEILAFVDQCKTEVGGVCKAVIKDGDIHVLSNHVPLQEVNGSTTEIDPAALGKLEFETQAMDGEFWVWWHSHVNMGTSPSGQDVKQRREFAANAGRCAAIIFNKSHNVAGVYCHALDFESDVNGLPSYIEQDIKVYVEESKEDERLRKKVEQILNEKVKPKVFVHKSIPARVGHHIPPLSGTGKHTGGDLSKYTGDKPVGDTIQPSMLNEEEDVDMSEYWQNPDYWIEAYEAAFNRPPTAHEAQEFYVTNAEAGTELYIDFALDINGADADEYTDDADFGEQLADAIANGGTYGL